MTKLTTDIYYLLLSSLRVAGTAIPVVFVSEHTGILLQLIHNAQQLDAVTFYDDTDVYTIMWPDASMQEKLLEKGCRKINVFSNHTGVVHENKIAVSVYPDIANFLLGKNKLLRQQDVCAGECAELISAIMDSRRMDREINYRHIDEEIVDVMLQINILSTDNFSDEWHKKMNKLKEKFLS